MVLWRWLALVTSLGVLLWTHGCHIGGHDDDDLRLPAPRPLWRR